MVAFLILGQQDKVVVGAVQFLALTLLLAAWRHIYLTAYYGLEMLTLLLELVILLVAVVLELLNAHHIAVISYGNTAHTIGYSLVYQLLYVGLAVKQRVLRMDMKMYKFLHKFLELKKFLKLLSFAKRVIHEQLKVFNKIPDIGPQILLHENTMQ